MGREVRAGKKGCAPGPEGIGHGEGDQRTSFQRVELGIDRAGVGHEGEERNTLEPATKSTSSGETRTSETMTSETSEMSDAPAAVAASQTASNDALPRFIASESYRRARLGTLLQQAGATSTSAPKP